MQESTSKSNDEFTRKKSSKKLLDSHGPSLTS